MKDDDYSLSDVALLARDITSLVIAATQRDPFLTFIAYHSM